MIVIVEKIKLSNIPINTLSISGLNISIKGKGYQTEQNKIQQCAPCKRQSSNIKTLTNYK